MSVEPEKQSLAGLAPGQDFLTVENWCDEAVRRWNAILSGQEDVQESQVPSTAVRAVRVLLGILLLCVAGAAFAGYRLHELYQAVQLPAARDSPTAPASEEELGPRSGVLCLVLGGITVVQLLVIILVVNLCGGHDSRSKVADELPFNSQEKHLDLDDIRNCSY
mmetsp:Transcript_50718/g.94778  ORF Transcript_50718/g.94778 Transcript_50718/m.94778 type:complete len:164 (+) Transcript_50718:85-576(+)